MRIVAIVGAALAAVTTLSLETASDGGAREVKEGGTFRVAVPIGSFDAIDPALAITFSSTQLLRPTCGTLMAFPDRPFAAGLRLEPELAESDPVISRDRRTYTFTVRKDARFSNGAPVTARAFERAAERIVDPRMKSPYAVDPVVEGDVARGRTFTIRLTRPVPDFPARIALLCAVPPSLPADPEGAKAPLPSAGPYYVAEYVPGERLVLERNRFYRGQRPQHVSRIIANLGADAGAVVDDVARGRVDYAVLTPALYAEHAAELARRYGVNKSRFFAVPGLFVRMFVLNTSRPLFGKNPKLRQALNFAVDRKALTRELGPFAGTPTDQYLPPLLPGYRDERIYPLGGPDVAKASALARGRTRDGKAVLYVRDDPLGIAQAQILSQNLKAIGLEVETKAFPGRLLFERLATPGEPFDIGLVAFGNILKDPSVIELFHGRSIGPPLLNWSYFNSPKFNRLMDRAARLSGDERYQAYGELDVQLSRDAAPAIPFANINENAFVSARVGCIVLNPELDLTAVCLK